MERSFRIALYYLQFCVFDCDAVKREEGEPRTQAYFMDFHHTSKYKQICYTIILIDSYVQ